ncbi:MAG: hypothetical protein NT062_37710 [Proteobacteria bacterium]|nr:hypothetical protein [Pseudomonadota bacterium]
MTLPSKPPTKTRLGWLGPVIVVFGLAIGGFGVWFVVTQKPKAGAVIDEIPIDATAKLVVRDEAGGDRSFVELVVDGDIKWQALVPTYAGRKGRPAIAWSTQAVLVRVVRNQRAEVFALNMKDASKLGGFRLAPNHDAPIDDGSPITVTDHFRSYEIISGPDWHQLVGIDLQNGKGLWRVELGPTPLTAAGVEGGEVWVVQGGAKRKFLVFTGAEKPQFNNK